ncbi:MAG: TNT domain-containing protein [Trueperella sp.]|uniref:glycohydrolase toxin TNT-related protein n=1 Tax=Trueperella sp. TaxID=2699835 RepID=UPI0025D471BF|nr:glycohydrolase toxin TNT-related protein [Trueperella sp.]MCI7305894.1 TNT domain-containing protein [Trueperella sp.]
MQALQSFEPETVRPNVSDGDVFALRRYGGESKKLGYYVTDTLPATRQSLALPPGNTMEHLSQFRLVEGTEYLSGRVGPNFGQPGGGRQYYLLDSPDKALEVLK